MWVYYNSLFPALQVSNVCFDFDGSRKTGERVIADSVLVGNEPLDMNRLYHVGTKSYLLAGKDGFDCFTKVREHRPMDSMWIECNMLAGSYHLFHIILVVRNCPSAVY